MIYSNKDTLITMDSFLEKPLYWITSTLYREGAKLVLFEGEEHNIGKEICRYPRDELKNLEICFDCGLSLEKYPGCECGRYGW